MPSLGYAFATDLDQATVDNIISAIVSARVTFADALDVNGELDIVADSVGSMAMTGGYVNVPPPDVNGILWVDRLTSGHVVIKNTGGPANAGAVIAGFFS